MPRDIRSYFTSVSSTKSSPNITSVKPKKRRVISSDEDDAVPQSPMKRIKKTVKSKKNTISSDSDEEKEKQRQIVSPADIFGKKPIQRKEAPQISKRTQRKEAKGHNDDDFEATLSQLDVSDIEQKYLTEGSVKNKETKNDDHKSNDHTKDNKKTPSKHKKEGQNSAAEKKTPENKTPEKGNAENSIKDQGRKRKHSNSPNDKVQRKHDDNKHKSQNGSKASKAKTNVSKMEVEYKVPKEGSPKKAAASDVYEERIEKKKQNVAMYQQYLQRGGARNPGSKQVPEGADYCLAGLSFLITGVLDSLEREEADELIKKYGGRILQQVSRKTDYVIVGDQPGPSKLSKADNLNIKKISEDDLLEMIRTRPAGKADNVKQSHARSRDRMKQQSTDSEDISHSPPKKLNMSAKEETEKPKTPSPVKKSEKVRKTPSPVKKAQSDNDIEKPLVKSPIKPKLSDLEETSLQKKNKVNDSKFSKVEMTDVNTNVTVEALVEKYRPKTLKQILGQQGDKSNAKKLYTWLMNWHKNQSGQVKHTKPSPWAKNDDGAFFKAALLSGPPGIGKTTTVQVACKELGFDLVEFNASDTRSKRLLKEEVSELLSNTTLKDYFKDNDKKPSSKHVLLMDEVDGMAGNEDRGGLQELISLIKSSDIPVVCICNDRNNPKMRTLSNYTFDLRFQKPRLEQIRAPMKSICFKEKIDISTEDLDRLIESTNQDIRQVINHLALYVNSTGHQEKTEKKHINKDLKLGPWDVVKKVFTAEEHKNMSIHDKSGLFFHDYSISPLFVQENYLVVSPKAPKSELLERVAQTAESLALGDMVEKSIRSNGSWSLLPMQACYSSVIPGTLMSGYIAGQINFPSWLGRNSKSNKFNRLTQEITVHARLATGASKEAINLDYIKYLRDSIVRPLAMNGTEGVDAAVDVMNHYHLLREDLDSLIEISLWPGERDPMQAVDSKVKAAFTRAYNKVSVAAPYAVSGTTSKKKTAASSQDEDLLQEEDEAGNSDDNDNEDLEFDKMIKAKKPSTSKKTETKNKGNDKTESKNKNTDKPSKRGRGRGKAK